VSDSLTSTEEVPFPSWEAWNRIRNGNLMPCLESDREEYESQKRFATAHIKHASCVACKDRFSDANCFTQAGWQETQISGLCERCFDQICAEEDDEEAQECALMDDSPVKDSDEEADLW